MRDTPAEYSLAGGELNYTLSKGDIYTGDTTPPPNNFLLQDASHAGEDWVIETKINSYTHDGGYAQGGLLAYKDGDNYIKFDAITDVDQPKVNRIELRSEIAGVIQEPQSNATVTAAQANGPFWLRLTKTGNTYKGEYSFDGIAWTATPNSPVTNPMAAAGLRSVRLQPAGHRGRRQGVVRLLHPQRSGPEQLRAVRRPGRHVRRRRARTRTVERHPERQPGQVRGRQRCAEGHHDRRRDLPGRHGRWPADPAGGRPRRGGLGPRDQAHQHAGRWVLAGRHPRLRRRQQLRQDQRDLRRRERSRQPPGAALRGRRHGERRSRPTRR